MEWSLRGRVHYAHGVLLQEPQQRQLVLPLHAEQGGARIRQAVGRRRQDPGRGLQLAALQGAQGALRDTQHVPEGLAHGQVPGTYSTAEEHGIKH